MRKKANCSETSSFGSPGRHNHDSSRFYGSRMYGDLKVDEKADIIENKVPAKSLDKIFCKSSERMAELPDNSVHLMVTSPPYNVGKEYDEDMTLVEYRDLLSAVWKEVYRVMVPGGRVCLNVANLGRKPYIPLHAFMAEDLVAAGFLMRGEVIWNKSSSAGTSTAWGSWQSARNPTLRDVHEYILMFSKMPFGRMPGTKKSTITRDEFLEFTKSVWSFGSESAKKIGHPAPYPVELPSRCIKLYTFEGDVVLDPFIGSGTTGVAAIALKRHFVGYEVSREYVGLAEKRIEKSWPDHASK
jgi:site-specific DNA-methyltransferase (adenine-specific)